MGETTLAYCLHQKPKSTLLAGGKSKLRIHKTLFWGRRRLILAHYFSIFSPLCRVSNVSNTKMSHQSRRHNNTWVLHNPLHMQQKSPTIIRQFCPSWADWNKIWLKKVVNSTPGRAKYDFLKKLWVFLICIVCVLKIETKKLIECKSLTCYMK